VSGLVAGTNVGVAPEAELMNFIMIPNARGNISDFIFAFEFIATRPEISIMNMSAGIPGFHNGMKGAVATLLAVGVLPVVAIGNERKNTSRSPGNYTEVLSIGASTKQDKIANFSGGGTMVVNNQSYKFPTWPHRVKPLPSVSWVADTKAGTARLWPPQSFQVSHRL